MIDVIKSPQFENDSYLITLKQFSFDQKKLNLILSDDPYLRLKFRKFQDKDISKRGFEKFKEDRLSLRSMDTVPDFDGSIYTHTVERKNDMKYESILASVKMLLLEQNRYSRFGEEKRKHYKYKNSRKMVLRIANSFDEYLRAEIDGDIDVSCLSMIQYLHDRVHLVFRASDIKNEIFPDILSVYWYFIKPVYQGSFVDISIYATTAQNVEHFIPTIFNLNKEFYSEKFQKDGYIQYEEDQYNEGW